MMEAVRVEAMNGFYWLIPGVLAGSPRPGGQHRWYERAGTALDADLAWLAAQGIRAILSLTEEPLPAADLACRGLDTLHLPIPDMTAPHPDQILAALAFIDEHRARGEPVVVHCKVGQGRTGTILAAYLIRDGQSPEAALQAVRAVCPGAVENPVQEAALARFAADRDWLI